jgi:hypothetical protein
VSSPELVRLREVVRGVDVEEKEGGIALPRHLGEGEDTETDAPMEAEGAEVAGVEVGFDRLAAGGPVRRTEGLDARRATAPGNHRVVIAQPVGEPPDERRRHERHVPGDADHRSRRLYHRGMDPAQGADAGPQVGDNAEIGPPAGRLGGIRDEQRRAPERVLHGRREPVENPLAAHALEPLRFPAEPGRPASREDGAPDCAQ